MTRYLERSWQYRRLLIRRLPMSRPAPRPAARRHGRLLVDLHRNGVYWGDCSLANTLFTRDGQALQAWLVDAETSEIHPTLSDGQRAHDLDILVENVAGGLLDLAPGADGEPRGCPTSCAEAESVAARYQALWDACTPSRRSPSPIGTRSRGDPPAATTSASPSTR